MKLIEDDLCTWIRRTKDNRFSIEDLYSSHLSPSENAYGKTFGRYRLTDLSNLSQWHLDSLREVGEQIEFTLKLGGF